MKMIFDLECGDRIELHSSAANKAFDCLERVRKARTCMGRNAPEFMHFLLFSTSGKERVKGDVFLVYEPRGDFVHFVKKRTVTTDKGALRFVEDFTETYRARDLHSIFERASDDLEPLEVALVRAVGSADDTYRVVEHEKGTLRLSCEPWELVDELKALWEEEHPDRDKPGDLIFFSVTDVEDWCPAILPSWNDHIAS